MTKYEMSDLVAVSDLKLQPFFTLMTVTETG